MAKLALKLRDQKRRKMVEKFKVRRAALLEIIYDSRASDEAREEARAKLQKLPRDASPVRLRNRCALTGRPRGVYRKFGLGRNKMRELALKGEVPGIIKASWEGRAKENPYEYARPDRRHADAHPQCAARRPHRGHHACLAAE